MERIILKVTINPAVRKIIEGYTQYRPLEEIVTLDTDYALHKKHFDDYEKGRRYVDVMGKVIIDSVIRKLPVGDKELILTLTAEE